MCVGQRSEEKARDEGKTTEMRGKGEK